MSGLGYVCAAKEGNRQKERDVAGKCKRCNVMSKSTYYSSITIIHVTCIRILYKH